MSMNDLTFLKYYLDYTRDLDNMEFPLLRKRAGDGFVEIKDGNIIVGFLMVIDNFVHAIYVRPESRRKGLAKKAVHDYVNGGGNIVRLSIIPTNIEAKKFWDSVFYMTVISYNESTVTYQVDGLKD